MIDLSIAKQQYRDQIVEAWALAETLLALGKAGTSRFSQVDTFAVTSVVSGLPMSAVERILWLPGHAHRIVAVVESDTYRCEIEFLGGYDPTITERGYRPADLDTEEFSAALDRDDGAAGLRLAAAEVTKVTLILSNDPRAAGQHWIAAVDDLRTLCQGPHWLAVISKLADETAVLVVQDAERSSVSGEHLQICGPDAPRAAFVPWLGPISPALLIGLPPAEPILGPVVTALRAQLAVD